MRRRRDPRLPTWPGTRRVRYGAQLRILQLQPAQQQRTAEQQLHRFMGSKGGRKIRYGSLLVDALDLECVPRPLDRVLDHIAGHD